MRLMSQARVPILVESQCRWTDLVTALLLSGSLCPFSDAVSWSVGESAGRAEGRVSLENQPRLKEKNPCLGMETERVQWAEIIDCNAPVTPGPLLPQAPPYPRPLLPQAPSYPRPPLTPGPPYPRPPLTEETASEHCQARHLPGEADAAF
ncbi:unnamed protein product [Gadus morhua 'NCC']